MTDDFKYLYSEFLNEHSPHLHMAGHSHHFWPDAARDGHNYYYNLAMKKSDHKWEIILGEVLPKVQSKITTMLNFSRPKDIAFSSNTHDLITRLISPKLNAEKLNILASKNEFHSISRQLKRLNEEENISIHWIDNEAKDFKEQLEKILIENEYDFIFMSHVFFNSGFVLPHETIELIIRHKKNAQFILDGYHHFCALPFNLAPFENDLFYIAGGYKYAQAGEGMCFMTMPAMCQIRPLLTGWFAHFSSLEKTSSKVDYNDDGMRFWGSTLDMSSFCRFLSVWDKFNEQKLTIEKFDLYIKDLQKEFLSDNSLSTYVLSSDLNHLGHFITFEFESSEQAKSVYNWLLRNHVMTDFRGKRLRFGFTPYLNMNEVKKLKNMLSSLNLREID